MQRTTVVLDSKVDYADAQFVQSPHYNKGRSGNAITCKFKSSSSPKEMFDFLKLNSLKAWYSTVQLAAVQSHGFEIH